jgi:hypothetical protein
MRALTDGVCAQLRACIDGTTRFGGTEKLRGTWSYMRTHQHLHKLHTQASYTSSIQAATGGVVRLYEPRRDSRQLRRIGLSAYLGIRTRVGGGTSHAVGVRRRRKHSVHVNVLQAKNFIGVLGLGALHFHDTPATSLTRSIPRGIFFHSLFMQSFSCCFLWSF